MVVYFTVVISCFIFSSIACLIFIYSDFFSAVELSVLLSIDTLLHELINKNPELDHFKWVYLWYAHADFILSFGIKHRTTKTLKQREISIKLIHKYPPPSCTAKIILYRNILKISYICTESTIQIIKKNRKNKFEIIDTNTLYP